MPFPFSPVHIPFVSGVRQDLGKLAVENPAQLRQAKNVLFTKKGHIVGRPALRSRDAAVQNEPGYAGIGPGTLLGNTTLNYLGAAATFVPAGIVATGFPGTNKADIDTPLICWQGKSYFNTSGTWEYAGLFASLRQTKSVALTPRDPSGTNTAAGRGAQIPVGNAVVGTLTTVGQSSVIPRLTAQGEFASIGNDTTIIGNTFLSGLVSASAVAGNAILWRNSFSGDINLMFPIAGTIPTNSITLTAGTPLTGPVAMTTDGSNFYALYADSATTTLVKKISSAGVVLQTLALVWTLGVPDGTVAGTLDICYDVTSNRLGLVAVRTAATIGTMTKILTLTAGTMADAGIDLTLTGSGTQPAEAVCCGVTHKGQMSVLFSKPPTNWTTGALTAARSGSLYIGGRSFTAATETTITTLNGAVNTNGFGAVWDPLFAGQVVANRTLVGVYRGYENANNSSQWLVLDVSELYDIFGTPERHVVAAGAANGVERCIPSSVFSDNTRVSFAVSEGTTFAAVAPTTPSVGTGSASIVRRAVVRRITLEPQAVQAVHANGNTFITGQMLHTFDGLRVRPHHFAEETPYIFDGGNGFVYTSAGGALVAGSYTYQATWELLNGRGQTTRSGASAPLTVTGVTINQRVSLHITKPQSVPSGAAEVVRIRLWATQTNPTNNAPKYLAAETTAGVPTTGFDVTLSHTAVATGVEEQLYETVDTLADMRAPAGDRGVAVVAERVWVADQNNLYVSKIIRPNLMVAWNTEATNTLSLPSTLGTIQALAAVNQGLVVLCSRGAAVVTGPGVDDTGAGPGWVLQIIDGVPGMGNSSPRSATAVAAGVSFQSQDGDIWLANSSGQALPMSRALRDVAYANPTSPVDLVNITPTPTSNSMLIAHSASVLRVLDLELGQWGTWSFPGVTPVTGLYLAAINGALWIQTMAPGVVFSADDFAAGNDAGLGNVTSTIETGILRPGNPVPHGWGRIRSVTLNEIRLFGDSVSVNMQIVADQNERTLMNKTTTTNANNPATFPGGGDGVLYFGTTVQRCSYARVIISFTPNRFDAEGLDLWVANTGERTPSNNRS